jgi:CO/xanthine dehydrogenase FAD-binding subunit
MPQTEKAMILSLDYRTPWTLEEACDLLWKSDGKGKVIAGGTDLVISLRSGDLNPALLIDVTRIPELQGIGEIDDLITIGAGVTHADLASSALLMESGKILCDAAREIGSPQIRNLGTLGGNVVNASPAADTVPALMVLDAVAEIASGDGRRRTPLPELFKGPYETALKPHEILTRISFRKLSTDTRSSFIRLARREAMAIARMSVALVLRREKGNGRIEDIRVSVGAVTPTPHRLTDVEAFLKGKRPDGDLLREASGKVSESMRAWSGTRPSSSYKVPVVEALFIRAVEEAVGQER